MYQDVRILGHMQDWCIILQNCCLIWSSPGLVCLVCKSETGKMWRVRQMIQTVLKIIVHNYELQ